MADHGGLGGPAAALGRKADQLSGAAWPPAEGPEHTGSASGDWGQGTRRRQGGGSVLATMLGVLLLGLGCFLSVWALTTHGGPPAEAQQIPASVGTDAPRVSGQHSARPLGASTPVRIVIPAIAVNAPVMQLGLNANGTLQVPPLDNHNLAGWYRGSVTPGQTGSSIMLGHVDTWAGGSVFFKIKDLHRGDQIDVVRADGTVAVFSVDGVQKAAKVAFPTDSVYRNPGYPALRLITCGGPFDSATGEYLDNIIVYANLTATKAR